MTLTFEQLMILIPVVVTGVITIIGQIKSNHNHQATQAELATAKVDIAKTAADTHEIKTNTNSTLTTLQNKLDLALEALKQMELVRAGEQAHREATRTQLLEDMKTAHALITTPPAPAPGEDILVSPPPPTSSRIIQPG